MADDMETKGTSGDFYNPDLTTHEHDNTPQQERTLSQTRQNQSSDPFARNDSQDFAESNTSSYVDGEPFPSTTVAGEQTPSQSQPFVRARAPHQTQTPVNDIQDDDAIKQEYSYDTSFTYSKHTPIEGRTYRRSRSNMRKAKQELKYGQYLSVPKGNREIFGSHDRIRRRQMLAIGIAIVIIILILIFFVILSH